jgi:ABC-type bacteriocin/lantibiotic exporter with double-glycine peptidase domain
MEAIIAQRRDMDCAVACLGWYFHLRYEDVFAEALKVGPLIRQGGLTVRQIQDVAKRLGYPLTRVHHSKVDLEEDVGILTVTWNDPAMQGGAYGHAVVLRKGTILCPRLPSMWDADVYLDVERGRIGTLLVEA